MQHQERPFAVLFDVNRTILIEDKAGRKSLADEIATILASSYYGDIVDGDWKLFLNADGEPTRVPNEGQISYYDYLRQKLPDHIFSPETPPKERSELVTHRKRERTGFLKLFYKQGQPGEALADLHQKLQILCTPPEPFTLLPSFYEAVSQLATASRPFSLVFRTFGEDLERIYQEWNLFCSGAHPMFPQFKYERYKLDTSSIGCFYRDGPHSDHCHLIVGTLHPPALEQGIESYLEKEGVTVYTGFSQIDHFFQQKYANGSVLAIRDYYPWWACQSERYNSGKLLCIEDEHANPNSTRIPQLFFDDHIHPSDYYHCHKLIVDVRNPTTGDSPPDILPFLGTTLVTVDPLDAIGHQHYFIDQIFARFPSHTTSL